jgi:hypothetical protein
MLRTSESFLAACPELGTPLLSRTPRLLWERPVTEHLLRRYWPQCLVLCALLAAPLYGAFGPLRYASREQLLELPKDVSSGRMKGEAGTIASGELRLTLGVRDVLLLRNSGQVPQVFGPVLVLPGHELRLPFEQLGDYQFACAAHASGQVIVHVVPMPDPGWDRLRWRWEALVQALRELPIRGPDR